MLDGLRTAVYQVMDLAAARDWYAEVLGVQPYFDMPFYVGFSPGGYELGLHPVDPSDPEGPSGHCAYWAVDDIPAAIHRLVACGARLVGQPQDVGDGIVVATLQDPFGNALGLIDNPHFTPGVVVAGPEHPLAASPDDLSERQIVHEAVVAASPAEVWPLWTTSEGLAAWLLPDSHVELRIGGPFELYFMPEAPEGTRGSEGCRILSYVPERMLSFTWNGPPVLPETREARTWVVLDLDAVEGGTRVRVTHLGWPESGWSTEGSQWPDTFAYFEAAWAKVLEALVKHFGG